MDKFSTFNPPAHSVAIKVGDTVVARIKECEYNLVERQANRPTFYVFVVKSVRTRGIESLHGLFPTEHYDFFILGEDYITICSDNQVIQ